MPLDQTAREVLHEYSLGAPAPLPQPVERLGFSGAKLWRADDLCLRAWPADGPKAATLSAIHRLMRLARDAGLDWVPAVLPARSGRTFVERDGRLWELTTWMRGSADFHDHPTEARLTAACEALAQLHVVWSREAVAAGPCPAVVRRLQAARKWMDLAQSGWRLPDALPGDPCLPEAQRVWPLLRQRLPQIEQTLQAWMHTSVPLQPCLCDVWRDHILFDGDAVSGIVDYGAVQVDNVAVDLARMLGSFVGSDAARWATGLAAYERVRTLSGSERALVRVLAETGAAVSAVNWLRWLYHEGRRCGDREAVSRRLAELSGRL